MGNQYARCKVTVNTWYRSSTRRSCPVSDLSSRFRLFKLWLWWCCWLLSWFYIANIYKHLNITPGRETSFSGLCWFCDHFKEVLILILDYTAASIVLLLSITSTSSGILYYHNCRHAHCFVQWCFVNWDHEFSLILPIFPMLCCYDVKNKTVTILFYLLFNLLLRKK